MAVSTPSKQDASLNVVPPAKVPYPGIPGTADGASACVHSET